MNLSVENIVNKSQAQAPGLSTTDYILSSLTVLQGVAIILGNLVIIAVISLNRQLRKKEFLLLLGLAVADFLIGVNHVYYYSIQLNYSLVSVTAWECISNMQKVLFCMGTQAQSFMLIALSVDRFIAVAFFKVYIGLSIRYSLRVLAATAAACVLYSALFLISVYENPLSHTISAPYVKCRVALRLVRPAAIDIYQRIVEIGGGYICVVLYIAILLAYRFRMKKVANESVHAHQLKVQKRMVKTVGWIVLNILLSTCTPSTAALFASFVLKYKMPSWVVPLLFLIRGMGSLTNIFIYAWRQKDMRQALKNFLHCTPARVMVTSLPPPP